MSDSKSMEPLDSVRFDTSGYAGRVETQAVDTRAWRTKEGDGVGLYFFRMPPDLPTNAASVEDFATAYRQRLEQSGGGGRLVEVSLVEANGSTIVRTIISVPQEPSGRTYVGALTIPFRDFSFVVKCQCFEGSPTGLKEAVLFDRSQAKGEVTILENGGFQIPGWNPDDSRYDAEFPHHPMARARRRLTQIRETLELAPFFQNVPPFPFPAKA